MAKGLVNAPGGSGEALSKNTFLADWDAAVTYAAGDGCYTNGQLYNSLLDANMAQDPTTAPTYWEAVSSGSGGSSTLTGLTDVPDNYLGQGGKLLTVDESETGIAFTDLGQDVNGSAVIPTTGWVANAGYYPYKLDLAITGMLSAYVVSASIEAGMQHIASAAGLSSTVDSYDGGITLYAKYIPTDPITFAYHYVKPALIGEKGITKSIMFYVDSSLFAGNNAMSILVPYNLLVTDVLLSVDLAPAGSDLIVDLNLNGTTLYTTQNNRPKITAGSTIAVAALPDTNVIAFGSKLTLDIDQVGSSVPGSNLSMTIVCEVM